MEGCLQGREWYFLELPAFCAQLSGLQLPERACRQLELRLLCSCLRGYRWDTFCFYDIPSPCPVPGPMRTPVWIMYVSSHFKRIQYCPPTTETAVLKCLLPLLKAKYFPNRIILKRLRSTNDQCEHVCLFWESDKQLQAWQKNKRLWLPVSLLPSLCYQQRVFLLKHKKNEAFLFSFSATHFSPATVSFLFLCRSLSVKDFHMIYEQTVSANFHSNRHPLFATLQVTILPWDQPFIGNHSFFHTPDQRSPGSGSYLLGPALPRWSPKAAFPPFFLTPFIFFCPRGNAFISRHIP